MKSTIAKIAKTIPISTTTNTTNPTATMVATTAPVIIRPLVNIDSTLSIHDLKVFILLYFV
jgi:hypothetical protein